MRNLRRGREAAKIMGNAKRRIHIASKE